MPPTTDLGPLVNPKERRYYALLVVLSLGLYGLIGLSVVGALAAAPDAFAGLLAYIIGFPVMFFVLHGLGVGYLRGNGVRASERQFPELLQMGQRHAVTLGLDRVPDLFVLQSGGVLNAFATRFLGRDFVVVYSDVLAMAETRGESAVSFIVAHELAHVKRGHLKHRWLTLPWDSSHSSAPPTHVPVSTRAIASARTASRPGRSMVYSSSRQDVSSTIGWRCVILRDRSRRKAGSGFAGRS